jgi:iron(III) transport system ATP-binding protein
LVNTKAELPLELPKVAGFLSVRNLCKRFGDHWAVDDVSFDVEEGKLLVLLGPSGCGKTTTLRCIGGLEQPDNGEILIDAQTVTKVNTDLFVSPENRGMGMVAQSYAIWPHMTVFENVAFPLRMRKERGEAIPDRVEEALRKVQLEGFGERNATDLSGGQQQRVALARAIIGRPKVLLFDEPLSNLDANLREQMRYLLKGIQREIGITAVYVTHDQDEAMGLGDELVVMNEGKIEQTDNARALYSEPVTQFVAEFIGVANLLKGSLQELSKENDAIGLVKLEGSDEGVIIQCRAGRAQPGNQVSVLVRPEWIELHSEPPEVAINVITGSVISSQYLGDRTELIVNTGFHDIRVTGGGDADYGNGSEVFLVIDEKKCIALPED